MTKKNHETCEASWCRTPYAFVVTREGAHWASMLCYAHADIYRTDPTYTVTPKQEALVRKVVEIKKAG